MRTRFALLLLATVCFAQQQPNVAAQREAMKKLQFLAGKWSGDATVNRGRPIAITQSEEISYKLDGLVMIVEGTGRNSEGNVEFRAFATISYDDASAKYRFRAYNDGRYLDTELEVTEGGFARGFTAGPAKVRNVMKLTAKGEWQETTEYVLGDAPPRKSVEMLLKKIQ
ncbi:MAG: hypothetical protein HY820_21540 [Acidobacteria bacterium]|nr:hypothetical protein [Acidobacteriota bacterium]